MDVLEELIQVKKAELQRLGEQARGLTRVCGEAVRKANALQEEIRKLEQEKNNPPVS